MGRVKGAVGKNHPDYVEKEKYHAQKKWDNKNPEKRAAKMRNYFMRIKYNLTIEKYDQLFKSQNGVCKICKKPETAIKNGTLARLSVDHDHVTGAIRGLLCSKCNHGLGNFEDSIENLESAINTLGNQKMNEWEKNRYYLEIAEKVSERATCNRKKVGAVIVLKDEIVSCGFNGAAPKTDHCQDVGCYMRNDHCVRCIHAEINALIFAKRDLTGAIMYASLEPCLPCSIAAINAGIIKIIYNKDYKYDEFKQLLLKQAGVEFRKNYYVH